MQCYLSGHSDGSLDSVDPSLSTEGSSSAEPGPGRDRDSGIIVVTTEEEKFERFDQSGSAQEDRSNH